MSDPFAFAGTPAALHDDRSIAELHRQKLALDERLRAARQGYDEVRRQAAVTGGACPRGGVQGSRDILLTEEAIDEDIDRRRREWTSPEHAAQLERERALLKGELAEYRAAREAFFEKTGMAASLRHMDEIEEEIAAVTEAIWAKPLRTMADLAAAFDLVLSCDLADAMQREGIRVRGLFDKAPHLARLILAVRQVAPEFEFSLIREAWHDYDAVIAALRAATGCAQP